MEQTFPRFKEEKEEEIVFLDGKDEFISEVARRAKFTKGDIRTILNVIIEIFMETVRNDGGFVIRGLGELYVQTLPARKTSKLFGEKIAPESRRAIFKLAYPIRKAAKESMTRDTQ